MKHTIIGITLAAVVACTPRHDSTQTPHNARAADLEAKTVALVMPSDFGVRAYCSGVWVAEDKIATAFNCIADEEPDLKIGFVTRGDVYAPDDDEVVTLRTARIMAVDPEHDLALLGVKLPPAHPIASVARSSYVGEVVQTMGHPRGLWWSYSAGNVAALRVDDGMWYVQSTAPISPGNSGGGLFDEAGDIIGIAHSYIPVRAENINLYVDARYLRAMLEAQ